MDLNGHLLHYDWIQSLNSIILLYDIYAWYHAYFTKCTYNRPGFEVIKLVPCSTLLSMKFKQLINTELAIIVHGPGGVTMHPPKHPQGVV